MVSVLSLLPLHVFFFNDTATTEIYTYWHTLSLHDALPISFQSPSIWRLTSSVPVVPVKLRSLSKSARPTEARPNPLNAPQLPRQCAASSQDRKSTRLNSSH